MNNGKAYNWWWLYLVFSAFCLMGFECSGDEPDTITLNCFLIREQYPSDITNLECGDCHCDQVCIIVKIFYADNNELLKTQQICSGLSAGSSEVLPITPIYGAKKGKELKFEISNQCDVCDGCWGKNEFNEPCSAEVVLFPSTHTPFVSGSSSMPLPITVRCAN